MDNKYDDNDVNFSQLLEHDQAPASTNTYMRQEQEQAFLRVVCVATSDTFRGEAVESGYMVCHHCSASGTTVGSKTVFSRGAISSSAAYQTRRIVNIPSSQKATNVQEKPYHIFPTLRGYELRN